MKKKAVRLILESNKEFKGWQFAGPQKESFGELVFNTAMSGYQEVLSDPSYFKQFVLMTYPMIGNYGINEEDLESRKAFLSGMLVREYCETPHNFRATQTLKHFLDTAAVQGVEGFDTRAITRFVREKGAQKAMLTASDEPLLDLVKKVQSKPGLDGQDSVKGVSTQTIYHWAAPVKKQMDIAVIDCGVKYNILRQLTDRGAQCTVFPYDVSSETLLNGGYDGIFISNGPGDPAPLKKTVQTIQAVLGKKPIFGICLGHQLLGLALNGKTYKLKFGHHGINHPVKEISTGRVEITSQNHGFCLDPNSLSKEVEVTHLNLYDRTNEGIRHKVYPAYSVQYHPESAPGPHDSGYLFDTFIQLIEGHKK